MIECETKDGWHVLIAKQKMGGTFWDWGGIVVVLVYDMPRFC